mgnify:CR=1 FL=1
MFWIGVLDKDIEEQNLSNQEFGSGRLGRSALTSIGVEAGVVCVNVSNNSEKGVDGGSDVPGPHE